MKNKTIFIILMISLCAISSNQSILQSKTEYTSTTNVDTSLNYLTPTDFDWTVGSFVTGKYSITPTTGDYFDYGINDTLMYFEEVDSYDCLVGAYATVPVTNGHLAFSFDCRAKADNPEYVRFDIYVYDPITYNRLQNTPALQYIRPGTTDTEYNYMATNISLPTYDEVILYMHYIDESITIQHQAFYVRDFRFYTSTELPLASSKKHPIPMDTYDWKFGSTDLTTTFSPDAFDNFDYSINTDEVYVYETGAGIYNKYIGAYLELIVIENQLSFAFEARCLTASADHSNVDFYIYDNSTNEMLTTIPSLGFFSIDGGDTDFNYWEFNIEITGSTEVILFINYVDRDFGFDGYEFWIRNFHLYNLENQAPQIIGPDDIQIDLGNIGNFLNWTLQDPTPHIYGLYRNDFLLEQETWLNNDVVSINVDFLAEGIYNFTIIAYDIYGAYSSDTVILTVGSVESTSFYWLSALILIIVPFISKRRRK